MRQKQQFFLLLYIKLFFFKYQTANRRAKIEIIFSKIVQANKQRFSTQTLIVSCQTFLYLSLKTTKQMHQTNKLNT